MTSQKDRAISRLLTGRVLVRVIILTTLLAAFGTVPALGEAPCLPVTLADDKCERFVSRPQSADTAGGDIAVSVDGAFLYVAGSVFDAVAATWDFYVWSSDAETGGVRWAIRWGAPETTEYAYEVAVSPDGSRVFVAGRAENDSSGDEIRTIAYNSATGQPLWSSVYESPGLEQPTALAVSDDGDTVVVAGVFWTPDFSDSSYITVALDTANGETNWSDAYHAAGAGRIDGLALKGNRAYVTGISLEAPGNYNATTIAYDLATGDAVWIARYDGGQLIDDGMAVAVSPDGGSVYVAAWSQVPAMPRQVLRVHSEFATIAYDAATGTQRWVSHFAGLVGGQSSPAAIGVSSDGSRVIVTGRTVGAIPELEFDMGTVAFDAATGAQAWSERYAIPGLLLESSESLAVGGGNVYVTGYGRTVGGFGAGTNVGGIGGQDPSEIVTIAYEIATGSHAWVARYSSTPPHLGYDTGWSIAAASTGVYVAGTTQAFGDQAYASILAYE